VEQLTDYDIFDVLIDIAYNKKPLKRNERVFNFQTQYRSWLSSLPNETKDVIIAIVNQFVEQGTDSIESDQLFNVYDVIKAGGFNALQKGGNPKELIHETKLRLFVA
jgi:type I restriction enzyme R subunit